MADLTILKAKFASGAPIPTTDWQQIIADIEAWIQALLPFLTPEATAMINAVDFDSITPTQLAAVIAAVEAVWQAIILFFPVVVPTPPAP